MYTLTVKDLDMNVGLDDVSASTITGGKMCRRHPRRGCYGGHGRVMDRAERVKVEILEASAYVSIAIVGSAT